MNFDRNEFAKELGRLITAELNNSAQRFKNDNIRALAVDCYPWIPGLDLSFLTDDEDYPEKTFGKWSMGDWKYYAFTADGDNSWPAAEKLRSRMAEYFNWMAEQNKDTEAAEIIIRACARALMRVEVSDALKAYKLTNDFELYINDPDDPEEKNFCDDYKDPFK